MADLQLAEAGTDNNLAANDINTAQRKRLERLDLLLTWDGSFGRKDLTNFFGISDQQASADIAKYREIAPGNTRYETKSRLHVATDEFNSVFVKPSADRYLDQLQGLLEETLSNDHKWFREMPSCDAVRTFHPDVKNHTLRSILRAIREKVAVKISYQPLTRADSSQRWIAPHALAFSGRRWHARAYCFESKDFRDFVLTRIVDSLEFRAVTVESDAVSISDQDIKWQNHVKVKITPCTELPDVQRRVIAKDYGMPINGKIVDVREALFLYFADWHRLDPTRYGQIPANERMIEAENWSEISAYMPNKSKKSTIPPPQIT